MLSVEAGQNTPLPMEPRDARDADLTVDSLLASFELNDAIFEQARHGSARRASVMLSDMIASDTCEPELASYTSVIASQPRSPDGSAKEAERILDLLRHSDNAELRPTAVIVNAVVDAHAKCRDGSANEALRLLRDVRSSVRLDTISYNTCINTYAKCQDGSAAGALAVLDEMRSEGIRPNSVTFHSLMDAQLRQQDGTAQDTIWLLDEMTRCCETPPDVSMFTTAINLMARSRDGSAKAALETLQKMKQLGITPSAVTLNSVIDAQAKQRDGSAKVALTILDAMKLSRVESVQPTVVTYTSVIDCQAKCADGDGRTAVALLEEMCTEGLSPNNMTFGCAMNAQAKRGSARMASSILAKMKACGLTPSHVQYNAVIDAHAKCNDGSALEALEVLRDMATTGAKPNVVSFSTCIDAQAKREDGSAEAAAALFEEMLASGVQPDTVTFAGVIDAQAKNRDGSAQVAFGIIEQMGKFVEPNQIHFNSAINACANQRPAAHELGEQLLAKMVSRGLTPNHYTLSALLRTAAFCSPPRPESARGWFSEFAPKLSGGPNDHVERALRLSFTGYEVDELLSRIGGGNGRRASRSSSTSSSPNSSPPLLRRASARDSSRRDSSSSLPLHEQQRRDSRSGARKSSDWRTGADEGPSASLFSQPMRSQSRRGSESSIDVRRGSNSWRSSRDSATTSTLFSKPMRSSFSLSPPTNRRDSIEGSLSSPQRRGSGAFEMPCDSAPPKLRRGSRRGSETFEPSEQFLPEATEVQLQEAFAAEVQRPRLSLTEKINKMRATPLEPRLGPQVTRRSSGLLLSPNFFSKTPPTPASSPTVSSRRNSLNGVVREPCGPDGSKGFMAARRPSFAMVEQSASAIIVG